MDDQEFEKQVADGNERIHALALRLGLPAPVAGQPLHYVLVQILEKLEEKVADKGLGSYG